MNADSRSVLLVVPEFPPNGSMGGRRWAKFAKYLAQKGLAVKVIAFEPTTKILKANWTNDIQHKNIEVYYLPSKYPKILQSSSMGIFSRILKKFVNVFLSIYDGGIIQDRSIFFKNELLVNASTIIKNFNIQNVVCTGPYHRACYFTVLLKETLPNLNIIVDFRDRWTDGQVYGIESLSKQRSMKEEKLQKYTCEKADYVISTYSEIIQELTSLYSHLPKEKFIHFPHNFDIDDYDGLSLDGEAIRVKERVRFLYGGTINTAAFNDAFKPFFYSLNKLKVNNNELYRKISIEIYGENFVLNELSQKLDLGDCVKISQQLPEKEFYFLATKCDFLLMFLGRKWKDLMTTKNITYLPFRKPFMLISERGEVSRMVEDNNIGFVLEPDHCFEKLLILMENYSSGNLTYNHMFDFSDYSYEMATERLIKLFKFDNKN